MDSDVGPAAATKTQVQTLANTATVENVH